MCVLLIEYIDSLEYALIIFCVGVALPKERLASVQKLIYDKLPKAKANARWHSGRFLSIPLPHVADLALAINMHCSVCVGKNESSDRPA